MTPSSQALSCSVSGILAWLTTSLLSLKQRLCNTSLFTGLGQLYPEMSLLHTFVQFACCSCYLYHFKTIWQQNRKAVMQKQNSKAIMQKATNSTDSKMQRNPKRKRNMFFFYKSKFQSRRSHLRLEKINESRMRIWDRRNKHIIWLFRPNPPLPTHQGARWRRSSMTGGAALSFCRHRGSATSQRRRQLSGDLDLGLRTSGPAALLTLSATVRGGF